VSSGYSGTLLPRKLGIKEGHLVGLLDAPESFAATLGELPDGVVAVSDLTEGPFDVILAFFTERLALEVRLQALIEAIDRAGGLWIAWPKRSSGVAGDVTENVVRELGLAAGVVDNKVCAVDETWSALRFVIRLRDR
jgi:hypothetical protein